METNESLKNTLVELNVVFISDAESKSSIRQTENNALVMLEEIISLADFSLPINLVMFALNSVKDDSSA